MPDTITANGPAMSAPDGIAASRLTTVSLDDKYTATKGDIFLSGIQALVRLPMMQRVRDEAAGLNTAGFISGYRGSPLGGLDENLWKAKPHLEAHHVQFVPGVNEDLAATAVWGSQTGRPDRRPSTTACSPCGTARARAWTAAATSSST
jgi:indolepyruvate ferredoxin oxidoreductase